MRCRALISCSVKITPFFVLQQYSFSTQRKRKLSKSKYRKNQPHRKYVHLSSSQPFTTSDVLSSKCTAGTLSAHIPANPNLKKKVDRQERVCLSDTIDEIEGKNANVVASSVLKSSDDTRACASSDRDINNTLAKHNTTSKKNGNRFTEMKRRDSSSCFSSAFMSALESKNHHKGADSSSSPFASLIHRHRIMRKNHSTFASGTAVWNSFSRLCMSLSRDHYDYFHALLQSTIGSPLLGAEKVEDCGSRPFSLRIWGNLPTNVNGDASVSSSTICNANGSFKEVEKPMKSNSNASTAPTVSSTSCNQNNIPEVISMNFSSSLEDLFSTSFELPFPDGLQEELMKECGVLPKRPHNENDLRGSVDCSSHTMETNLNPHFLPSGKARWHKEWISYRLAQHECARGEGKEGESLHLSAAVCGPTLENHGNETERVKVAPPPSASIFFTRDHCAALEEAFGFPPVSKSLHKNSSHDKKVGSPEWQQARDLQRHVVQEMFWLLKTISFFRLVKEEYRCRYFTLSQDEWQPGCAENEGKVMNKTEREDKKESLKEENEVNKWSSSKENCTSAPSLSQRKTFVACLKELHSSLQKYHNSESKCGISHGGVLSIPLQNERACWWNKIKDGKDKELIHTIQKYLTASEHGVIRSASEWKEKGPPAEKTGDGKMRDVHILDLLYHLLYRYAISNFLLLNAKDRGLCFRMSLLPNNALPLAPQFSYSFACWYALLEFEGLYALAWRIIKENKADYKAEDQLLSSSFLKSLFPSAVNSSASTNSSFFPLDCVTVDFSTFSSEMRIFANVCSEGLSEDICLRNVVGSLLKEYKKHQPDSSTSKENSASSTIDCTVCKAHSVHEVVLASETLAMDFQRLALLLPRDLSGSSSPLFFSCVPYYFLTSQWWRCFHQIFDPLLNNPSLWMSEEPSPVEAAEDKKIGGNALNASTALTTTYRHPLTEVESKILSPLLDAFHIEDIHAKVRHQMRSWCAGLPRAQQSVLQDVRPPCWWKVCDRKILSQSGKVVIGLVEQEEQRLHQPCGWYPPNIAEGKSNLVIMEKNHHLPSLALLTARTMMRLGCAALSFATWSSTTSSKEEGSSDVERPHRHPRNERFRALPFSSSMSEIPSLLRWVGVQPSSAHACWSCVLHTVHTQITPCIVSSSKREIKPTLTCLFKTLDAKEGSKQLQVWKDKVVPLLNTGAFSLSTYLGRVVLREVLNELENLPKRWLDCVLEKEFQKTQVEEVVPQGRGSDEVEKQSQNSQNLDELDKNVQKFLLDVIDFGVCAAVLCIVNHPEEHVESPSFSTATSTSTELGISESDLSTCADPFSTLLNLSCCSLQLPSLVGSEESTSSLPHPNQQTTEGCVIKDQENIPFSLLGKETDEKRVPDLCFRPLSREFYKKLTAKLSSSFSSAVKKLCAESWASPDGSIYSLQQGVQAVRGLSDMIEDLSFISEDIHSMVGPSSSTLASLSLTAHSSTPANPHSDAATLPYPSGKDSKISLLHALSALHQHIFTKKIDVQLLQKFLLFHERVLYRAASVFTITIPCRASSSSLTEMDKSSIGFHPLSDPSFILPKWAVLLARDELKEEHVDVYATEGWHGWLHHLRWTTLQEGMVSLVQKRFAQLRTRYPFMISTCLPLIKSSSDAIPENIASVRVAPQAHRYASTPSSYSSPSGSSSTSLLADVIRSLGFPLLSKEEVCVVLRILSRMRARQGTLLMKAKPFSVGNYGTPSYSIFDMMSEAFQNEMRNTPIRSGNAPTRTLEKVPPLHTGQQDTSQAASSCSNPDECTAILADVAVVLQLCLDHYLPDLPLSSQLDAVFIGVLDVTNLPSRHAVATFDTNTMSEDVMIKTSSGSNGAKTNISFTKGSLNADKTSGEVPKLLRRRREEYPKSVWPVEVKFDGYNGFVASVVLMRHAPFLFARSGGWKYNDTLFRTCEGIQPNRGRRKGGEEHRSSIFYHSHPLCSYAHDGTYPHIHADVLLRLSDTLQEVLRSVVASIIQNVGKEQEMHRVTYSLQDKNARKAEGRQESGDAFSVTTSSECSNFFSREPGSRTEDKKNRKLPATSLSSFSNYLSSSLPYGMLQCYCLTSYLYVLLKQLPPGSLSILSKKSDTAWNPAVSEISEVPQNINVPSLFSVLYAVLLHTADKLLHQSRVERIFADELLWCLAFSACFIQEEILGISTEKKESLLTRKQWWSVQKNSEGEKESETSKSASSPASSSDASCGRTTTAAAMNEEEEDEGEAHHLSLPHSFSLPYRHLPNLLNYPLPNLFVEHDSSHPIHEIKNHQGASSTPVVSSQGEENSHDPNDIASPLYRCQLFNAFYWPRIWAALYPEVQAVVEACSTRGHVKMATNIIFSLHALRSSQAPFLREREFSGDSILHRAAGMSFQYNGVGTMNHNVSFQQDPKGRDNDIRANEGNDLYQQIDKRGSVNVPSISSLATASAMLPGCTRSCTLIAQQIRSAPASFSLTEIRRFLLVLRNWGKKVHDMDYQYHSPPSHPTDGGGESGNSLSSDDHHHSLWRQPTPFNITLNEGQKVVWIRGSITHSIPAPQIRAAWAALSRRLWNGEILHFVGSTSTSPACGRTKKMEESMLGEVVSLALHTGALLECSDTLLFRQLLSFLLYGNEEHDTRYFPHKKSVGQNSTGVEFCKPISPNAPALQLSAPLLSTWTTMVEACAMAAEDRQEYAILLREMFISRLQGDISLDLGDASMTISECPLNVVCRSPSLTIPAAVKQFSMILEALGKICIADVELWDLLEKAVKKFLCVQLDKSLPEQLAEESKESLLQSLRWGSQTAGFF